MIGFLSNWMGGWEYVYHSSFWDPAPLQNSKRALNTRGEKNLRFSTEITFNSETVWNRLMVAMFLSDLERRDVKGSYFHADLRTYTCAVWPETTEFGTRGRGVFVRESATHLSQGSGASASHKTYAYTVWRTTSKFRMMIKLERMMRDEMKNF